MAHVLIPLPLTDFDPTESAVPWRALVTAGHRVSFATPDGAPGAADPLMCTGKGLGPLAPLLMADANGRQAYAAMLQSAEFQKPLPYADLQSSGFDALLLPGGHAPGMWAYRESRALQDLVVQFFAEHKPVAAICHGVLLAARSLGADGRSVLYGRKTTALTGPDHLAPGFCVQDGNYLSARWPGDAHRFAAEFVRMLAALPQHWSALPRTAHTVARPDGAMPASPRSASRAASGL